MFSNMGVHIIDFPSGRFGFVGSLPPALGDIVAATAADIMAGRAFSAPDGTAKTIKFPSFATRAEAAAHAAAMGITVRG